MREKEHVLKLFGYEETPDVVDILQIHCLYLALEDKLNEATFQFREECMATRGNKP